MRRGSPVPQPHADNSFQRAVVKPPIPPKPILDTKEQKHYCQIQVNQPATLFKYGNYNPCKKEKCKLNALDDYNSIELNMKDVPPSPLKINYDNYDFRNDLCQADNCIKENTRIITNKREVTPVTLESNINCGNLIYKQSNSQDKNESLLEKCNQAPNCSHKDELFTRTYSNPETHTSLITINQSIVSMNSHENQPRKFSYRKQPTLHSSMPKKQYTASGGNVAINGVILQKRPHSDIPITTGITKLYNIDQVKPKNQYNMDKNMILPRESMKATTNMYPESVDMPDSLGYPALNSDQMAMMSNAYIKLPQNSTEDKSLSLPSTGSQISFERLNQMHNSLSHKHILEKNAAIEIDENYDKKLSRGISRATENLPLVSKARSELAQGIWDSLDSAMAIGKPPYFVETPLFTFTLPDLSVYSDNFRTFLEKDLIETASLVSLETSGRLNWWSTIGASQRLWPLATTGDGNCLLHAASLGMWGFHDRLLTLRKALHEFLTKSQYSQPLWRRWRWQLAMQNRKTGLVYNSVEWQEEWQNVIKLASSKPRSEVGCHDTESDNETDQTWSSLSQGKLDRDGGGNVYESLEEIHVLALSHVLRRPIIVVADVTLKDVNGAPLAPIPFGGIYLPLECPPKECQKSPLLLTYDAAHFSALVVMETSEQSNLAHLLAVIPVTDNKHELLPIQFLIDPGEEFGWGKDEYDPIFIEKLMITPNDQRGLLSEYLNLVQVPIPSTYLDPVSYYNPEDPDAADIDKKSSESSFDSDDGRTQSDSGAAKTKSKQIQTVVKQFGSIGRSMSKRIKKNLNTLSKLSRTGSFRSKNRSKGDTLCNRAIRICTQQSYVLGAEIHIEKRQAYQEEMIKNYLNNAKKRFKEPIDLPRPDQRPDWSMGNSTVDGVQCVNSGCSLFATAETSYLCSLCYERQKMEEEQEFKSSMTVRQPSSPRTSSSPSEVEASSDDSARQLGPQYGAGKSKFYADLDAAALMAASQIPISNSLSAHKDRTLYLSNSKFYNDSNMPIPSYNMQKNKNCKVLHENRSCGNTNHLSSKSNVVYVSTNSGSSNKQVASIAPISIDDSFHKDAHRQSSLYCLSSGCEFFGNPSKDGYCSKCYLKRKSSTKSLYVEGNKTNFGN